jgi:hypothetical protein
MQNPPPITAAASPEAAYQLTLQSTDEIYGWTPRSRPDARFPAGGREHDMRSRAPQTWTSIGRNRSGSRRSRCRTRCSAATAAGFGDLRAGRSVPVILKCAAIPANPTRSKLPALVQGAWCRWSVVRTKRRPGRCHQPLRTIAGGDGFLNCARVPPGAAQTIDNLMRNLHAETSPRHQEP